MKQRLQGVVIGVLMTVLLLGTVTVFAASIRTIEATYGISVVVNGVRQNFASDMQPFSSGGRTFLPVRGIADALGLDVEWDGSTSTVYLTSGATAPATVIPTPTPPITPTPPPALTVSGNTFGDTITFDGLEITFLNEIEWALSRGETEIFIVSVRLKNISNESHNLNMFFYTQFGPSGTELSRINDTSLGLGIGNNTLYNRLQPGAELNTQMAFRYEGDGVYIVEFRRIEIFGDPAIRVSLPVYR